jgi:hypothetical protein
VTLNEVGLKSTKCGSRVNSASKSCFSGERPNKLCDQEHVYLSDTGRKEFKGVERQPVHESDLVDELHVRHARPGRILAQMDKTKLLLSASCYDVGRTSVNSNRQ